MANLHADFSVHVVEVCRTCSWNHLVLSYVLGTGGDPDTGRTATGAGASPSEPPPFDSPRSVR